MIFLSTEACKVLELSMSEGKRKTKIKASYHRLSLLYHPDKNPDEEATKRFQEINEAHEFLMQTAVDDTNDRYPYSANVWMERLLPLLRHMGFETVTASSSRIVQFLVSAYDTDVLSRLNTMKKEKLHDTYKFVCQHRRRFPAVVEPLINYIGNRIGSTAHTSNEKDQHVILHPTLDDVLGGKVIQYEKGGLTYHVPSWNAESVFDWEAVSEGGEFIVHCVPVCPSDTTIDDTQCIHKHINYTINEVWDPPDNDVFKVEIVPGIHFAFTKSVLNMTRTPQIVPFYCKGIPLINPNDALDTLNKGSVNLHITIGDWYP